MASTMPSFCEMRMVGRQIGMTVFKHLWIVGTVTLLWNVVGAFDYVLTETRNESYMGAFTPEQLEFFYGFPTWVVAFWAICSC